MIFSFSRLSLYLECPYRFYKKYILKIEEDEISLPLAFGKAAHKGIEDMINQQTVNVQDAALNGLIEADFHEEINYKELIDMIERGVKFRSKGQTEIYFELPLDDSSNAPIIRGYIDLLDRNEIVDWKTNRVPYDVLDTMQIPLYAWATSKMYNLSEVKGTLYFLRYRKPSSYLFSQNEMEEVRLWALGLANEINEKVYLYEILGESEVEKIFPNCPSNHCKTCPFAIDCYRKFGV